MSEIINLIKDNPDSHRYHEALEIVCKKIEKKISFVIQVWNHDIPQTKYDKVLILTSDEGHNVPNCVKDNSILHIFKQYVPMSNVKDPSSIFLHEKITPLPLCELYGIESKNIKICDRTLDWSFMGQNDPFARQAFVKMINKLSFNEKFNHKILLYNGWNKGLSTQEYCEVLNNTKIAFVPNGSLSIESFRFYEAMKCGCAIISLEQPKIDIYQNAPYIKVNNWEQAYNIFHELITDVNKLNDMSQKSTEWFKKYCSPESISSLIISKL